MADPPEIVNLEAVEEKKNVNGVEDAMDVQEPKIGMLFDSIEDLVEYYRTYGNKKGFEVCKRTSTRGDDGAIQYMTLVCSRFGKEQSKPKNAFKLPPVRRTECEARLRALVLPDKKWRISSLVLDHNHELSTPSKVRYFKRNRVLQPHVKRKLEVNDKTGIRLNKNFNSLVVEAGGHDNLTFTEKDCRNYIEKIRRLRLGEGDVVAVQQYFARMQLDNSNFFYVMDLNEEGRLRNLFWADARCRASFKEFGDVVTFDTTYLTNKYDMPFAPFVGVNHHGQSILLGCGLISNEDTETFKWLFQSWLTCMYGCAPQAMITDQDRAMKKAIEIVFPSTRHRWCLCHIMKKIPHKLQGYTDYQSIKAALKNAVHNSVTVDKFEEKWHCLIEEYDLLKNEWLQELYDEKRRWVPPYMKDTFWVGMSSTQRSESMNSFFDGYVHSKTTLKQFVEQYKNALRDKVEKENAEDFSSFNARIPCISQYGIEKQMQNVYTTSKFKEFQHELASKLYCDVSPCEETDGILEFVVVEDIFFGQDSKQVAFTVHFNKEHYEINCSCRLFEFRGILCRHVISVFIREKISHFPEKYILRRWRKDIKRCHTKVKVGYVDWSTKIEVQRFDNMCTSFHEIADFAAEDEDKYNLVMKAINDVKMNIGPVSSKSRNNFCDRMDNEDKLKTTIEDNCIIVNPQVVRSKGRPPIKRKQSKVDQIIQKKKNKTKLKGQSTKMKESETKDACRQTQRNDIPETFGNSENMVNDGVIGKCSTVPQVYTQHGSAPKTTRNVNTENDNIIVP